LTVSASKDVDRRIGPTVDGPPQPRATSSRVQDDPLHSRTRDAARRLDVALLTGCQDRPYAFGLATALGPLDVHLDFVASGDLDSPELRATPNLRFLNFEGVRRNSGGLTKVRTLLTYYLRLLRYAATSQSRIFHILWNNRLQYVDRTLLMLYYKLQEKKIVLTAHNVNQARRDRNDTLLNRLTLRIQYRLVDHIFVHTEKMKTELIDDFGVADRAITILTHPINDAFPDTQLTPKEAKRRLGLTEHEKTLLFLGRIRSYKGLEYLLTAFERLVQRDGSYRLVIAGEPKKGDESYFDEIRRRIAPEQSAGRIILDARFIPDSDMELYLKAADALVLPYKDISQSGVLFLAFTFGLPVIAADVGSFGEVVVDGRTGFLFRPEDPDDLMRAIEAYFNSGLYANLDERRVEIGEHFKREHSWAAVAESTRRAYSQVNGH
jgi:glycosyltransferase involved in cell wall biosynthesis